MRRRTLPGRLLSVTLALAGVAAAARDADDERALEAAIAQAEAGAIVEAAAVFRALRRSDDAAVAAAAGYDFARARFERAQSRPRPGEPPRRPALRAVADARAQLAVIRNELEDARAALLGVVEQGPDDLGALAACATVAGELRLVAALDRAWEAAGEAVASAAGAASKSPLKPGPSGAKSEAGAPGRRSGAGSEGGEPGRGDARPAGSVAAGEAAPDAAEIAARLDAVQQRLRELDQQRAAEALRRSGTRRH